MRRFLWQSSIAAMSLAVLMLPGATQPLDADWRPEPPDPQQIAALEELSSWLAQPASTRSGRRPVLREEIRRAIRQRSHAFEMLRTHGGEESRQRVLEKIPYGEQILEAARRNGVDALLLAAIVEAESNFRPHVISSRGAVGLAQVMPATARSFGTADPRDPRGNLYAGAAYLRRLQERFGGDIELALAAYNAGPSAVRRYGKVPPYAETQRYVEKVLAIYVEHQRSAWTSTPARDALLTTAVERWSGGHEGAASAADLLN